MFAPRSVGKDVLMLSRVFGFVFVAVVLAALAYVFVSDRACRNFGSKPLLESGTSNACAQSYQCRR